MVSVVISQQLTISCLFGNQQNLIYSCAIFKQVQKICGHTNEFEAEHIKMYTVPIIAPDLRHEETIIQAARALDCLRQTIDNIFQRLDARIATNSVRVEKLGQRIQTAEQRIHNLAGVKNALQLYAPARFPAAHVLREPTLTFPINMVDYRTQNTCSTSAATKYEVQSRVESVAVPKLQDKLVYFHVRSEALPSNLPSGGVPTALITTARNKLNHNAHALGPAPNDLRSTVSLLRFNSETLAYNEIANAAAPAKQDNWRQAKLNKPKRILQQILEPAPHSIAHRNQRASPAGELRYTPKMHEAPTIDLPMDLPTLEGVAQDIHFTGLIQQQQQHNEEVQTATTTTTTQQQSNVTVITTTNSIPVDNKTVTAVTVTPTPPPPPPPPPAVTPMAQKTTTVEAAEVPLAGSDSRSALMDAIRKAGGAHGGRLRSAAAAPVDMVDHKLDASAGCSSANSGGDLMADLHNKLLMRRKGISGINAEAGNKGSVRSSKNMSMGNPVIQRLSALIPPPPTQQRREQHYDEDAATKNDDDDDWD